MSMITVAEGFQTSVNIAYDLNDENKLKSYIPTRSALSLLEDILRSTKPDNTDRARILIGAYGKGKSHIVLMILSVLMKKNQALFEKMMPVIKDQQPNLYTLIQSHYEHGEKLLPVVISGSSNSIVQAFMLALQRTLEENELQDVMPETNYQAAIRKIEDWKKNYPDVFHAFESSIDDDAASFEARLQDFDPSAYREFEDIFPKLTAGSAFNPFIGFDVAELYMGVARSLHEKGYGGLYVVYDEFSKYIENHISEASENDTKTLQDFAEACSRSGRDQVHLMLISHKEITSYIGSASKEAVDGWRGVSERFRHVYLNNNFTQSYEIIASAIRKDPEAWEQFTKEHQAEFNSLTARYSGHPIFSDLYEDGIKSVLYDCYPLHPVSTFILPRLSERVAQNERTLFTFLSATGSATLTSFLKQHNDNKFALVTPDLIYDYFEPLLRQEVYSGNLHKYYTLASSILRSIPEDSFGAKIVKTIAVIYILEQFEKLSPTMDELVGIYSCAIEPEKVKAEIEDLIKNKYVVYLKRSNGYLKLKETSGVNISEEISNTVEKRRQKADIKSILNSSNFDNYMYPSRYNDEKDMTRYFCFEFIRSSEASDDTNWTAKRKEIKADGVIFAVIPDSMNDIARIRNSILETSSGCKDCVFIIPKQYRNIEKIAREYDAVRILMDGAGDDRVLFDDYEVVYEDCQDIIRNYIGSFTRPENREAVYIYNGERKRISRKSEFSGLLSDICDTLFPNTPVINNEVINKEEITSVTRNSRSKIIAALLREKLEPGLGLKGNSQEVSIMRSTLMRTGILTKVGNSVAIDFFPADKNMRGMLRHMMAFVLSARKKEKVSFGDLYEMLASDKFSIGLRKGVIPIYLSTVLHEYMKQIVIRDRNGQVPLNADTIEQINADPSLFTLSYINWDTDKEEYIQKLSASFCPGRDVMDYDETAEAMRRWYLSLPKYARNIVTMPDGSKISPDAKPLMNALKRFDGDYDLLFGRIPDAFGSTIADGKLADRIIGAKDIYDNAIGVLKQYLAEWMRKQFCTIDTAQCEKMSLTSIIRDWCEKIEPRAFEQIFPDGTSRCLDLFKNITNNEDEFVAKAGRMATDLRLEDWDSDVIGMFKANMTQYRSTAEGFHLTDDAMVSAGPSEGYTVSFDDGGGSSTTKRFESVETSSRGKLLYNSIMSDIDGMGQSISEAEKRQIIMDVLKRFC